MAELIEFEAERIRLRQRDSYRESWIGQAGMSSQSPNIHSAPADRQKTMLFSVG